MNIKKGIYKHFKGETYKVLGLAKHSETFEELVLYRAMYGKKELWIRPTKMFLEKVVVNGKKVPRFQLIKSISKERIVNRLIRPRARP